MTVCADLWAPNVQINIRLSIPENEEKKPKYNWWNRGVHVCISSIVQYNP